MMYLNIHCQQKYWHYPALQPRMDFIDGKAPANVSKLKVLNMNGDNVLFWTEPSGKDWKDKAVKYVVYRFLYGEKENLDDARKIVAITTNNFYKLPAVKGEKKQKYIYYVTALDRLQNESDGVKVKVKM